MDLRTTLVDPRGARAGPRDAARRGLRQARAAPGAPASRAGRTAEHRHALQRLGAASGALEGVADLADPQHAGVGVDLGAEVEALHRRRRSPRRARRGSPGRAVARGRRGWSGSPRRAGPPASGCGAAGPRSWGASAGRPGRCGRRSRAARARRTARPTEDQVSRLASPKKYVETPHASGLAEVSRAIETNRSAPVRLAKAARSTSSPGASAQRGVVRKAWTPMATSRPSTRWARSCRIASETGAWSTGRLWPRPTSITTVLPPRWGPASRIRSWARSALGAPPLTIGESRVRALRVAGPQVPSGGMPKLRWNSRTPASVSGPK